MRSSKNPPEDLQSAMVSADAGFTRNISEGQYFMTISDVHVESRGTTISCREHSYPRNHERTDPKGLIRGTPKMDFVRGIVVIKIFGRYRIEILIDSMGEDGTQSRVAVTRSVERYATELALNHTKPVHCDEGSAVDRTPRTVPYHFHMVAERRLPRDV